jgi:hypothetical protein
MMRFPRSAGAIAGVLAVAFAAATALPDAAWAQAKAKPVRVRGTIESVQGNAIHVKDRAGKALTVVLPEKAPVRMLQKVSIDAIKKGDYLGITSMPQKDGTLKAVEVQIFPASMRGTGEGTRPWDLKPGSLMTNAAVDATVAGVDGRVLTMKYKGEEKKVVVPPDAPIVALGPGDRSLLKPGNHVFIVAATPQADGTLLARNITVGKDGLVPPM